MFHEYYNRKYALADARLLLWGQKAKGKYKTKSTTTSTI